LSIFLPFITGCVLFNTQGYFSFLSLFTVCIAAVLIKRGNRTETARFLAALLALLAGFYYAQLRFNPEPSPMDIMGKPIVLLAAPTGEAFVASDGEHLLPQAVEVRDARDGMGNRLHISELRVASEEGLQPGKTYRIRGYIAPDAYGFNPGGSQLTPTFRAIETREAGAADEGVFTRGRQAINSFMRQNLSSDSAGFLMSIITGERSGLTREVREAFNATGLAHILSISGAHFGLLLFICFRTVKLLIRVLPYKLLARLTLRATISQMAAVLCAPVITGYLLISMPSYPAMRSFIMIVLFLAGLLVQRKGFWLNTLLLSAVLILLMQPEAVMNLSFQLSFVAVLCIGIAAEHIKDNKQEETDPGTGNGRQALGHKLLRLVLSPMIVSLYATIGTAPMVAYYFHYFSLISPLTNLVLTPLIGFVILPLAFVSSFTYLFSGYFPLAVLLDNTTLMVLGIIKYMARWDGAVVQIPSFPPVLLILFYSGLFVYVYQMVRQCRAAEPKTDNQSLRRILLSAAVPLALAVAPIVIYAGVRFFEQKTLSITQLDVGQGDSAVAELPDGRTLVIDTGKNGYAAAAFLRYRGIRRIDAIVLSHGERDHAGGLRYLLSSFNVSEVWDNGNVIPEGYLPEGIVHRSLERGDRVDGRGYSILVLHPYKSFHNMDSDDSRENNHSLVMKITGRKAAFLFTGDIGPEADEDLSRLGDVIKTTVLKVPHHGSRTSSSEEFIYETEPEAAVISVGRDNSYGHPHRETLEKLQGAVIFRTDRDGAAGFTETPDGKLEFKTWEDFRIKKARTFAEEAENVKKLFSVW
jgi:competence protein ComEC